MNRRALFSFLAAAPFGVVAAVKGAFGAPVKLPTLSAIRAEKARRVSAFNMPYTTQHMRAYLKLVKEVEADLAAKN